VLPVPTLIFPLSCAGAIATADNEHPTYNLIAKKNGYEIRQYAASGKQFWVEATTNSTDYSAASSDGFQKLFKFITGKNSANLKINMTSPVTMHKSGTLTFFFSDLFSSVIQMLICLRFSCR
jgi:hypothetical protein